MFKFERIMQGLQPMLRYAEFITKIVCVCVYVNKKYFEKNILKFVGWKLKLHIFILNLYIL